MLYVNGTSGGMTTGNAVIHAGNISSQSVNYANSAGSLSSMNISQFTNNSNYATQSWTSGFLHQGNGGAFADLTTGKDSNHVTFDQSNPTGAPASVWYNGFVTTHANYLSSYIINEHRSGNWYLGWRDTGSPSSTWRLIMHSGNYNSYAPTLTGGGASGTWSINVTGSAGSLSNMNISQFNNNSGYITSSGSASSAGTITGRQRGSFTVGGNVNTFYPVAFQIGSGATGEQGISVLQIERGGYDEPGYSNYTFSTFHCRIRAKADGWGYGASYVQVEANAYTTPMLAEVTQQNQTSQLIVWLRGGCSYRWMDIEGGWSLNFSNPSGGNYSTFNGNAVYSPTTTNTIGGNFKYQQGWGNNYISGRLTAGNGITAQSQIIAALHSSATPDYSNPLWIWAAQDSDAIVIQNTTGGGTPPKIYFRDTNGTIQTSNTLIRLRTSNSDSLSAWLNGSTWNVTGDVVAYASDKRLKENIKTIPNAIEKVSALSGVTFDWNTTSEKAGFVPKRKYDEIGVLAQDVQNVLPQAVEYAPFDRNDDGTSKSGENYLTVKYEKIVPLLIEAVKEQQSQIEELKKEIKELKNK
jgi:hypothetical protein